MQKGISEPIFCANFLKCLLSTFISNILFNATKVVAASLEPPPRPPSTGILFFMVMLIPLVILNSSKNN